MNTKWVDWIEKLDGDSQLSALIMLLCMPILFVWLILDIIAQRYKLGRWSEK